MKGKAPWKENVESFLVLFSILALISGAFLVYALDEKQNLNQHWLLIHVSLALSLLLFIYSAEQTLDAADEDDVLKYIFSFVTYDLAVIFLLLGLTSIIYFKLIFIKIASLFFKVHYCLLPLCFSIFFVCITKLWWDDLFWLIHCSESKFQKYKRGLEGTAIPTKDRRLFYRFFYYLRRKVKRSNDIL